MFSSTPEVANFGVVGVAIFLYTPDRSFFSYIPPTGRDFLDTPNGFVVLKKDSDYASWHLEYQFDTFLCGIIQSIG